MCEGIIILLNFVKQNIKNRENISTYVSVLRVNSWTEEDTCVLKEAYSIEGMTEVLRKDSIIHSTFSTRNVFLSNDGIVNIRIVWPIDT